MYGPKGSPKEYTTGECDVLDFSTIKCQSVELRGPVGIDMAWMLDVAGVISQAPSTSTNNYGAPAVSSFSKIGSSLDTRGKQIIEVNGINFGIADEKLNPIKLKYGPGGIYSPSNCFVSVAHSQITCNTTAGVGLQLTWSVFVGGQWGGESTKTTSYIAPRIDSANVPTVWKTTGSDKIVLTGDYFGPMSTTLNPSPTLKYTSTNVVYDAVSCSVTIAHTQLTCTSVAGVGREVSFQTTIGEQTSNSFLRPDVRYAAPQLATVSSPNGPIRTEGGDTITLKGSSFGPSTTPNNLIKAFYGPPGVEATIAAQSCSPVDDTVGFISFSFFFSFFFLVNFHFHGIEILWENFICSSSPLMVLWKAIDTSFFFSLFTLQTITCVTSPGVGKGHTWGLTVAFQDSPKKSQDSTSYRAPVLSEILTPNSEIVTNGGTSISIQGTEFGPLPSEFKYADFGYEITASYGPYKAQNCRVTQAHSMYTCESVEGKGGPYTWKFDTAGQTSTGTVTSSYARPIIDELVDSTPFTTRGGSKIQLRGQNFAKAEPSTLVNVSYGIGTSATGMTLNAKDCSTVVSHKVIECTTVPGAGRDLHFQAVVAGLTSDVSSAAGSYKKPVVSSLSGVGIAMHTQGGDSITISGDEFGNSASFLSAYYGRTPPFDEVRVPSCTVSKPFTEIVCVSGVGVGKDHHWIVKVANFNSSQSTHTTSYIPPALSNVVSSGPHKMMRTVGGDTVTLTGTNLGPPSQKDIITLRWSSPHVQGELYETSSCHISTPHSVATCTSVRGVGANHTFSITIGAQESARSENQVSYLPPIISRALVPCSGPVHDSTTTFSVHGTQGFGVPGRLEFVGLQNMSSDSFDFDWSDPLVINGTAPVSPNAHTYHVIAWIGAQSSELANIRTFRYFHVADIFPRFAAIRGNIEVHVLGENFVACTGSNPQVRLRHTSSTSSAPPSSTSPSPSSSSSSSSSSPWITLPASIVNRTAVRFVTPTTLPLGGVEVQVQLNGQQWVPVPFPLTIFPPAYVVNTLPHSGPVSGQTSVVVSGYFPDTGSLEARVGSVDLPCQRVSLRSLQCSTLSVSKTTIGDQQVSVSVDVTSRVYSNDTVSFQYYIDPNVTLLDPPLGPIHGGTVVILRGNGIVPTRDNTTVSFGGMNSTVPGTVLKDSQTGEYIVRCRAPAIDRPSTKSVEMALNGQQYTLDGNLYDYYKHPVLANESSPTFGRVQGQLPTLLEAIEGSHFTPARHGTYVRVKAVPVKSKDNVFYLATGALKTPTSLLFSSSNVTASTGFVRFFVSLNGQDFSPTYSEFEYYDPPRIDKISPRSGPIGGGTNITLTGRFYATGYTRATIGPSKSVKCTVAPVGRRYVTSIVCYSVSVAASSAGQASLALTIDTNDNPTKTYSNPKSYLFYGPYSIDYLFVNTASTNVEGQLLHVIGSNLTFTGEETVRFASSQNQRKACGPRFQTTITLAAGAPPVSFVIVNTKALITAGNMQPDCSDIVFMDPTLRKEVAFVVEPRSCNTVTSRIWFRLNDDLRKVNTKTLLMLHGDPSESMKPRGKALSVFSLTQNAADTFETLNFADWVYGMSSNVKWFDPSDGGYLAMNASSTDTSSTYQLGRGTSIAFQVDKLSSSQVCALPLISIGTTTLSSSADCTQLCGKTGAAAAVCIPCSRASLANGVELVIATVSADGTKLFFQSSSCFSKYVSVAANVPATGLQVRIGGTLRFKASYRYSIVSHTQNGGASKSPVIAIAQAASSVPGRYLLQFTTPSLLLPKVNDNTVSNINLHFSLNGQNYPTHPATQQSLTVYPQPIAMSAIPAAVVPDSHIIRTVTGSQFNLMNSKIGKPGVSKATVAVDGIPVSLESLSNTQLRYRIPYLAPRGDIEAYTGIHTVGFGYDPAERDYTNFGGPASGLNVVSPGVCAACFDDFEQSDSASRTFEPRRESDAAAPITFLQGGAVSTVCGGVTSSGAELPVDSDSGHALVFGLPSAEADPSSPRIVQFRSVDAVFGGRLSFYFRPLCPQQLQPKPIALQYSNDGGKMWDTFEVLHGDEFPSSQEQNWFFVSFDLPYKARTATSLVRLYQAGDPEGLAGVWAVDYCRVNVIPRVTKGLAVFSIRPKSGPVEGFTRVVVRGANFTNLNSCMFGDYPASSMTFVNSTMLICYSPEIREEDAGLVKFKVCGSVEAPLPFHYYKEPKNIGPRQGLIAPDSHVWVGGDHFIMSDEAQVRFSSRQQNSLPDPSVSLDAPNVTTFSVPDIAGMNLMAPLGGGRLGYPFGGGCIARSQFRYLATEVQQAGIIRGDTITRIRLGIRKAPAHDIFDFQIAMTIVNTKLYEDPSRPFYNMESSTVRFGPSTLTNETIAEALATGNGFLDLDLDVPLLVASAQEGLVVDISHRQLGTTCNPYPGNDGTDRNDTNTDAGALLYRHAPLPEEFGPRGLRFWQSPKTPNDFEWPYPNAILKTTVYPFPTLRRENIAPVLQLCVGSGANMTCPERVGLKVSVPDLIPKDMPLQYWIALNGQQFVSSAKSWDNTYLRPGPGTDPTIRYLQSEVYNPVDAQVRAVVPVGGSVLGQTIIEIQGGIGGFPTGGAPVLRFRSSSSETCIACTWKDDQTILCTSPSFEPVTADVGFALNGFDFIDQNNPPIFHFFQLPELESVTPSHGPTAGGIDITISGKSFVNLARMQNQELFRRSQGRTFTVTELGNDVEVPEVSTATVDKGEEGTSHILCLFMTSQDFGATGDRDLTQTEELHNISPALWINETTLVCQTRASDYHKKNWGVFVSFNGALQNIHFNFARYRDTARGLTFVFEPCPGGSFAERYSQPCEPCPPGTATAEPGQPYCPNCPIGYYQQEEGQTSCSQCPSGSTTQSKFNMSWVDGYAQSSFTDPPAPVLEDGKVFPSDCTCAKNTFYDYDRVNRGECTERPCCSDCPKGLVCPGSIDVLTNRTTEPYAMPDYYYVSGGANHSGMVQQCTPKAACFGGPTRPCTKGYAGIYCGECVKGYYKDGIKCFECPKIQYIWLILLGILFLVFLYLFAQMAPYLRGMYKPRILYNFIYAMTSLQYFKVEWPVELVKLMDYLKYLSLNIDIVHPECEVNISTEARFFILQSFPIMLIVIVFIGYMLHEPALKAIERVQTSFSKKAASDRWHRLSNIPLYTWRTCRLFIEFALLMLLIAVVIAVEVIRFILRLYEWVYDRLFRDMLHQQHARRYDSHRIIGPKRSERLANEKRGKIHFSDAFLPLVAVSRKDLDGVHSEPMATDPRCTRFADSDPGQVQAWLSIQARFHKLDETDGRLGPLDVDDDDELYETKKQNQLGRGGRGSSLYVSTARPHRMRYSTSFEGRRNFSLLKNLEKQVIDSASNGKKLDPQVQERLDTRAMAINALAMLIVFMHPPLLRLQLDMILCQTVVQGREVLVAYPNISCASDLQNRLSTWAIILMIGWFAAFFIGILSMWHTRESGRRNGRNAFEDEYYKAKYGFMYMLYRPQFWFWEFVLCLRKAALAAIVAVLYANEQRFMQVLYAAILFVGSLALQRLWNPFLEDEVNMLESVSLSICVFVFVVGSALLTDEIPYGSANSAAIGWILALSIGFFALLLLRFSWLELLQALPILEDTLTFRFIKQYAREILMRARGVSAKGEIPRVIRIATAEWDDPEGETTKQQEWNSYNMFRKKHLEVTFERLIRLGRVPILSQRGHSLVHQWVLNQNTSARDAEVLLRGLELASQIIVESELERDPRIFERADEWVRNTFGVPRIASSTIDNHNNNDSVFLVVGSHRCDFVHICGSNGGKRTVRNMFDLTETFHSPVIPQQFNIQEEKKEEEKKEETDPLNASSLGPSLMMLNAPPSTYMSCADVTSCLGMDSSSSNSVVSILNSSCGVCGFFNGDVGLVDASDGSLGSASSQNDQSRWSARWSAHTGAVTAVYISKYRVVSCSTDGSLAVWKAPSEILKLRPTSADKVRVVDTVRGCAVPDLHAFTCMTMINDQSDRAMFITGHTSGYVYLWSIHSRSHLSFSPSISQNMPQRHRGPVRGVCSIRVPESKKFDLCASYSGDGSVLIWTVTPMTRDNTSGSLRCKMTRNLGSGVRGFTFRIESLPGGSLLSVIHCFAGCDDGSLHYFAINIYDDDTLLFIDETHCTSFHHYDKVNVGKKDSSQTYLGPVLSLVLLPNSDTLVVKYRTELQSFNISGGRFSHQRTSEGYDVSADDQIFSSYRGIMVPCEPQQHGKVQCHTGYLHLDSNLSPKIRVNEMRHYSMPTSNWCQQMNTMRDLIFIIDEIDIRDQCLSSLEALFTQRVSSRLQNRVYTSIEHLYKTHNVWPPCSRERFRDLLCIDLSHRSHDPKSKHHRSLKIERCVVIEDMLSHHAITPKLFEHFVGYVLERSIPPKSTEEDCHIVETYTRDLLHVSVTSAKMRRYWRRELDIATKWVCESLMALPGRSRDVAGTSTLREVAEVGFLSKVHALL